MMSYQEIEKELQFRWSDYIQFLSDEEKYSTAHPPAYAVSDLSSCVLYPNQLKTQWMGACAFQSWIGGLSSSRGQMLGQHVGQTPLLSHAEERLIQTDADSQYAKYTMSVSMPTDGYILRTFEKYPKRMGFLLNPKTTVLYEGKDGTIGHIDLINHECNHQYFGVGYVKTKAYNDLIRGNAKYFEEGEIFLKSPAVSENNRYCFGVNANVAICNHYSLGEDGIRMRRGFAQEKLHFNTYHNRWGEYGTKSVAKNLYGDEKEYKIMPDIGEKVADHGYLCATGPLDDQHLTFVEQTTKYMQVIGEHDIPVYVGPRGTVVDVDVWHDQKDDHKINPVVDAQILKYYNACKAYYKGIYDYYKQLVKERGSRLKITDELKSLITVAETYVLPTKAAIVIKKKRIDRWIFNVTVKYDLQVGIGFKGTGLSGDKGIFCDLADDEEMPVDEYGRRADIMFSDDGTVSRNNVCRLQEHFTNSGANEVVHWLCKDTGLSPGTPFETCIKVLNSQPKDVIHHHWMRLLQFYEIVRPEMRMAASHATDPVLYLATIVAHGLKLHIPTDNEVDPVAAGRMIQEIFSPLFGPVTFVDNGRKIVTKHNVRIAQMYVIILEKIANTWSAVSSGKTHHHGLPSQISNIDKYMYPGKASPVRFGESEMRVLVNYAGTEAGAELLDRSGNPKTRRTIVNQLMRSNTPTKIADLVDRCIYPFGGHRPLSFFGNYATCGGYGIDYTANDMSDQFYRNHK